MKQQYIYGQLPEDHTTEMLRAVHKRVTDWTSWVPSSPSDTLAAIEGELYKRCCHCGEKREAHAASGKCLFESTYFKRGAKP